MYDLKIDGRTGALEKFKARLVFLGCAQTGDSYTDVFASTVRYASVRIILAIGALLDRELFNVDIRGAFLAADLDVELFMAEPPGFETIDNDGPAEANDVAESEALEAPCSLSIAACWSDGGNHDEESGRRGGSCHLRFGARRQEQRAPWRCSSRRSVHCP